MPQLRQNVITGDWVVIAPERSKRPTDFINLEPVTKSPSDNCPFCPTNDNYTKNKLAGYENESIYVIPNKFPAFVESATVSSARGHQLDKEFYPTYNALGGHDVLIIKEHDLTIYSFNQTHWNNLFLMAQMRYKFWQARDNSRYPMMIYNSGPKSGESIHHPHAQIMASEIMPNTISKELSGSKNYYGRHYRCVFCDLISQELSHRSRIIEQNSSFVAFTFYAARFPFEVWIAPKNHSAHFAQLTPEMSESLSEIMAKVIARLGHTLKDPSLNFFIHDLPVDHIDAGHFHWHLEITPRLTNFGGYELGSGIVIDVIAPEEAAGYLLNQ